MAAGTPLKAPTFNPYGGRSPTIEYMYVQIEHNCPPPATGWIPTMCTHILNFQQLQAKYHTKSKSIKIHIPPKQNHFSTHYTPRYSPNITTTTPTLPTQNFLCAHTSPSGIPLSNIIHFKKNICKR